MLYERNKTYARTQWAIVEMESFPPSFLSVMNEDGTNEFSSDSFIVSEDSVLIKNWIATLIAQGRDVESVEINDLVQYSIN